MASNPNEVFPLVDRDGRVIGSATRYECHHRTARNNYSMLLHPVIHVHIFSPGGRLLLQRRSQKKDLYPGFWDTSVGGHMDCGESPLAAAVRETREELGVALPPDGRGATADVAELFPLGAHVVQSEHERELVYVFVAVLSAELPEEALVQRFRRARDAADGDAEVDEIRFWDLAADVRPSVGKGRFTLHFEVDFFSFLRCGLAALRGAKRCGPGRLPDFGLPALDHSLESHL